MTKFLRTRFYLRCASGLLGHRHHAALAIVVLLAAQTIQTAAATDHPALRLSDRALPLWITTPNVYFAGEQASLPLVISDTVDCTRLRAVLVQLSSKLQVELEQPHKLNCEDGPASASRVRFDLLFEFRVPDVQRKSRFEWRFAHCGAQSDACQSLLSVPFLAYPSDLLDPARRWAKANGIAIFQVFDRLGLFPKTPRKYQSF